MTSTATMPEHVVASAIELERERVRRAFQGVYRPDGSVDEQALARFAHMVQRDQT